MKTFSAAVRALILLAFAWVAGSAMSADAYPSAPIRLIVPFPAGSTTDVVARLLAQRLGQQMGTAFIVDNKLGAAGNIGNGFVASARPDGYTLLFNTSGVVLNEALGEKLSWSAFKDLTPVGFVAAVPLTMMVSPTLPIANVDDFVAYLKAHPDKLAYGSGGIGNVTHLAPLLFLQANQLTAVHVPYKGVPPVILDLIAGRIQFAMVSMLSKDDRVKVIATTGLRRTSLLPDVPTLAEAAMPGFEASSWFGIMAPAGTPPAIVQRLNAEIATALTNPEMKKPLEAQGIQVGPSMSVQGYDAYLKSEAARWSEVIKSAGVKLE